MLFLLYVQSVVSRVHRHQPVLDQLVHEGCQLTDRPSIVGDVDNIQRQWNTVSAELERRTHVLQTVVSFWTQYTQLVSRLREQLSDVSDKLQSDIRPNMHTANLTSLANVLKMNQVFLYFTWLICISLYTNQPSKSTVH